MKKSRLLLFALIACCSQANEATKSQLSNWEEWKETRMKELKSKDGYLNLAGLYWLKKGENTFGSDSSSAVVFPKRFPENSGVFLVEEGKVRVENLADGILIDSASTTSSLVFDLEKEVSKEMSYGSYIWFVIERQGDIGIRLKNLNHPSLSNEVDLQFFDYNPNLRVQANFSPYKPSKKLRIDNILGHEFEIEIEGQLQFQVEGKSYSLEPMFDKNDFFVIFSDETSAIETYGSGRYIHVPWPDENGNTAIDFNRSYNPPCAFSDFATCLIPPKENRLAIRIEAGELDYHAD